MPGKSTQLVVVVDANLITDLEYAVIQAMTSEFDKLTRAEQLFQEVVYQVQTDLGQARTKLLSAVDTQTEAMQKVAEIDKALQALQVDRPPADSTEH
jgi:hypothetical protein